MASRHVTRRIFTGTVLHDLITTIRRVSVQVIHTVVIRTTLPVLQIHNLSLDVDYEKKKETHPPIVPAHPSLYARNWHTGN